MASEEKLFEKLDQWLAEQSGPVDAFTVINSGDASLMAAYLLRLFRQATREAVLQRLDREAVCFPEAPAAASAVARIFQRLARAWSLSEAEQMALLGFEAPEELQNVMSASSEDVPIEIIERVTILLDTFQAINILLPIPERADAWLRRANDGAMFGGRPALEKMTEEGLEGLRAVRAYLRSELAH